MLGSRAAAILATGLIVVGCAVQQTSTTGTSGVTATPGVPGAAATPVALPSPRTSGPVSLEETLARRRSIRELTAEPLTPAEIGQLLWAAQGVTDAQGRRTAPSAGALYPLELYAVTAEGASHYLPAEHALLPVKDGDLRPRLRTAAFDQAPIGDAPLVVVVVGVPSRTEAKYGVDRARRYVALEAGHAAQDLLLQAVALGLGGVPIGAFNDPGVAGVLGLPADEEPLYLLAVGHPR
jgi:SagB-type dehydrogenase family enzyme